MSSPDPKELKKLVKVCRELGVKSFKGEGFEFQLSDEAPAKKTRKGSAQAATSSSTPEFETDSLTNEQLLMWSASAGQPFAAEETNE